MSIRAFFIVIVAVGLTFWLGFRNYPADIRVFYQNGDRLDAPLISAILAAAASIIAIIALIVNSSVNLRNKRLDVTIHCNTRYDDIYKTRGEIAKKTGKDASVPAPTERVLDAVLGLEERSIRLLACWIHRLGNDNELDDVYYRHASQATRSRTEKYS